MLKKAKCRYCVSLFKPVRIEHFYCSDTCRKLQFKAKKRAESKKKSIRRVTEKLIKLSGSSFGRYLVRELKRAKTVEILQGHDFESLVELVKLRRKCTASSGYDNGESLGAYELSHIYPSGGAKSKYIGLLHPLNLTITPKDFNRKHASKVPTCGYTGLYIAKSELKTKWVVTDSMEALEILKIARQFVGEDFDRWLKKHLITYTQKQALVKVLKEAGLPSEMLKEMSLKQLKQIAAEEELPHFDITKSADDIRLVLPDELNRLNIGSDMAKAIESLITAEWGIETPEYDFMGADSEIEELEEFLIQQSLACLHGQPYVDKWNKKQVMEHFNKRQNTFFDPSISRFFDEEPL